LKPYFRYNYTVYRRVKSVINSTQYYSQSKVATGWLCKDAGSSSSQGYLDTCPKNDIILFSRKGFCAFGLELGLGLRWKLELTEMCLNTILVNRLFGQVY